MNTRERQEFCTLRAVIYEMIIICQAIYIGLTETMNGRKSIKYSQKKLQLLSDPVISKQPHNYFSNHSFSSAER